MGFFEKWGKFKNKQENYGKSYEGKIKLNEDEWRVLENDPNLKPFWEKVEKISNEQDLGDYLSGFDFNEEEVGELSDFENQNILQDQFNKRNKKLAVENKEKEKEKEKEEDLKEYSLFEFNLIEEAFRYKTLLGKSPLFEKKRPSDADGKSLSDEEIGELAKKSILINKNDDFKVLIKKDKSKEFSKIEKDLINECAIWDFFYKEITKEQKKPQYADGSSMQDDEIDELVAEYLALKKDKPMDFAELKLENGEWMKEEFNWQEEDHKGKKQIASYQSHNIKDSNDKPLKFSVKYILKKVPQAFKLQMGFPQKNYFTIEKVIPIKENFSLALVELKPPYDLKEPVYSSSISKKEGLISEPLMKNKKILEKIDEEKEENEIRESMEESYKKNL